MRPDVFHRAFAVATAIGFTSLPALGEDEAERAFKAKNALEKQAQKINEACGTKIEAVLDYDTFEPELRKRYSLASWCQHGLSQLKNLCRGPKTKAHIAERVKVYRCTHAKGDRDLTIDDEGNVTLFVDFDGRNYGEYARRELVRKL